MKTQVNLYEEVQVAYKIFLKNLIDIRNSFGCEKTVFDAIEDIEIVNLDLLDELEFEAKRIDRMNGEESQ